MTALSCGDLDPVEIDLFIGSTPCPSGYIIDFGLCDIEAYDSVEKTITVKSAGTSDLYISSVKLSGAGANSFILDQDDYSGVIGAQRSIEIGVEFFPGELGAHSCTLEIASNDASEPAYTLELKGTGAKTVEFESLTANGSDGIETSDQLTLVFSEDPVGLLASDITIVGATAGLFSTSGAVRTLSISGIIVENFGPITLSIGTASGYIFSPSYRSTEVYKNASYVSPNIGVMKYVPAGRFQRDDTEGNISIVSAFRISRSEVTREQFLEVLGYDPSDATSSGIGDPVQFVNWYHAVAFCNKLSIREGMTPVYSVSTISDWAALSYDSIPIVTDGDWNAATANWNADGYRLPTEMEWMWAAMGAPVDGRNGSTNTTGYLQGYAGSDEGEGQTAIGLYAWYESNSSLKTHPIEQKNPNDLELYDMTGNVWEWCWDWYASTTPAGILIDYRGATSVGKRVFRGGSWKSAIELCALDLDCRGGNDPYNRFNEVGFRVVRK